MSLLDNFGALSAEKLAERKADLEAIEKNIKAIAQIGSDCLGDIKFKKYRAEYEKIREEIIDFMMVYANPDPIQDGHFLRACVSKLSILKIMIDGVQKDVKRKVK
jgi:hypothetical protein